MNELKCIYNNQKSFYKKAMYKKVENSKQIVYTLYSYNTTVLKIIIDKTNILKSYYIVNEYTDYSMTTIKHVTEMIKQFLPVEPFEALFKNKPLTTKNIMQKGVKQNETNTKRN